MKETLALVNEEFSKLRLKKVSRDNIILFFEDATAGIQLDIEIKESKRKLLNVRLIKIAMEIQEKYCIPGFILRC